MAEDRKDGVYLVKVNAVIDFEDCGEVHFFNSLYEAQNMFKKLVQQTKKNNEKADWVTTQHKDYYCTYEDGSYSENHIVITVERKSFED